MPSTDDWGGVAVNSQPQPDDWGGIPVTAPKIPDTSGVIKMAQDNLAAHDDKDEEQEKAFKEVMSKPILTPQERLDTAAGMPVQNIVNGNAKPSDINAANRKQYVGAIKNGSAATGSDWMQTALHAISPVVRFMGHDPTYAKEYVPAAVEALKSGFKGAAGLIEYPFVSDASKEELRKGYDLNPDTSGVSGNINRALELEQATVGRAMGGIFAPVSAPLAPILGPVIGGTGTVPEAAGVPSKWAQIPPKAIGAAMDVLGFGGIIHGARSLRAPVESPKPSEGPWDNHPGSEPIKDMVAQKQGVPPEAVTSEHIDSAIAAGSNHLFPAAQDFKDVETVTDGALKEETLHTIYVETGVRPDQVFEDARADPQVAQDVVEGKVPEIYEHLVESKIISPEQGERLTTAKSDTGTSFNVVDEQGDFIQGGFESAQDARHYIEDKKAGTIPDEPPEWSTKEPVVEKTPQGEQTVLPGAEKITDRALAERRMEEPKKAAVTQKAPDEGLFDTGAQRQTDLTDARPVEVEPPTIEKTQKHLTKNTVPPSEIGKPTSLSTFIKNNGGIKPSTQEASWLTKNHKDLLKAKGKTFDDMGELAYQHGYFSERPALNDFVEALENSDGGRTHFRDADAERVMKAEEARAIREQNDPARLEHEAAQLGLDTERVAGESEKQYTNRLLNSLRDFYSNESGTARVRDAAGKWILTRPIEAVEKWAGKLTGGVFQKLGEGYAKTFQPELMGNKALRADSFMAKYKAVLQEAENTYYRQSAKIKKMWDKKSHDERMEWLYDHETGRWNEELDPDHARYEALLDATFKAEKEAIGADAEKGYKENYLPHVWENPDAVKEFFNSDAMIKKYGKDGFTKASTFQLIQDGVRAGFKLKTDNPEAMLVGRLLAGHNMIATMDLLRDMEGSGLAVPARAFSVDKRIAKLEQAIIEAGEKYKAASDKINDPKQLKWDFADPAVSKYMKGIEARLESLKARMEEAAKEKASYENIDPELKKNSFKIIGPDSKVWNIHSEVAPLWKNAMDSKGLWENQGVLGDAYRSYYAAKSNWVAIKLGLSLFHPVHVAAIHIASDIATMADHLIHGGKFSELALGKSARMGLTKETAKLNNHPLIQAWNTPLELRTPEQQYNVAKMVEGGFKPTMSARDTVHFRENFDKAISGLGPQNLRLIGVALQLPGKVTGSLFMEHWIPGLKAEIYDYRTELALKRDPSLKDDAGRRGEVFRQIAKDTDRTYGEMNQDVQFWNKTVRDSFNAAFISGGWKLAQLYNAKGLVQPLKIAGKFLKTGEFSKADITYNMLNAYAYTAVTLATGAAILKVLGQPIAEAGDDVWDMVKNLVAPKTGEKNPDGTPIRLQQPAFAKEGYMLAKDINTEGLISGTGSFIYHATLIPGILNTLNNHDFIGREIISNPTDLNQWMNAGWNAISPIAVAGYDKAEEKNSDIGKGAQLLGFPLAGAYMNQTPFEQQVLYTYSEQNPPKGDVYSAKLKGDLRSAVFKKDAEAIEETKQRMREEGMTETQIHSAEKIFTTPFVDVAWDKLSAKDQKKLIESASEEEKQRFRVKQ